MDSKLQFESIQRKAIDLGSHLISFPNKHIDQLLGADASRIKKVISIGGCPSSGTTLVADLIDSADKFFCDPELGFMSISESYHSWDTVRQDILLTNKYLPRCGYSAPRSFFNTKYLNTLLFDKYHLQYILHRSSGLHEFIQFYSAFRSHARNKSISFFAEKTPGNICFASDLLSLIPNSYFICVVRHPASTINSLLRRGYEFRDAVWIWLSQSSYLIDNINHPRFLIVRYEELIESPFCVISKILGLVCGFSVNETSIQLNYEANSFRKSLPRPSSWRSQGSEWGVHAMFNENVQFTRSQIEFLRRASFAKPQSIAPVSTLDICDTLDYSLEHNVEIVSSIGIDIHRSSKRLYLDNERNLFG